MTVLLLTICPCIYQKHKKSHRLIYYLTSSLELPPPLESSPSLLMVVEDIEMTFALSGSQGSDRGGEVPGGGESDSDNGEDRQVTISIHRSISPLTIKLNIGGMLRHLNFADCAEQSLCPSFEELTELCRQYGSEVKDLSGLEVKFFLGVLIPLNRC